MKSDVKLLQTLLGRLYIFNNNYKALETESNIFAKAFVFDSDKKCFISPLSSASFSYPPIIAHAARDLILCQTGVVFNTTTQSSEVICIYMSTLTDSNDLVKFHMVKIIESQEILFKESIYFAATTLLGDTKPKKKTKGVKRQKTNDTAVSHIQPKFTLVTFDGPGFCFIDNDNLFICIDNDTSETDLNIHKQSLAEFNLQSALVLWIQPLDLCRQKADITLVTLIKGNPTLAFAVQHENTPNSLLIGLVLKIRGHVLSAKTFDTTDFIPDIYTNIISCLCIRDLKKTEKKSGTLHVKNKEEINEHGSNVTFENICYLSSSFRQLLCFVNGNIHKIFAFDRGNYVGPDQELHFISATTSEKAYLTLFARNTVWVFDLSLFKYVNIYNPIGCLLVDDFVGLGSDQLLLLPDPVETTELNHPESLQQFILSDLSRYHVDKRQRYPCGINQSQSNQGENDADRNSSLQTAVKALTSRVQDSMTKLLSAERQKQTYSEVTEHVCNAISHLSLNKSPPEAPPHMISHLVTLLPGKKNHNDSCLSDKVSIIPVVEGTWHKVICDDVWVVGAHLRNTTGRDMWSLTLTLTTRDNQVDSTGNCITLIEKNVVHRGQNLFVKDDMSDSCLPDFDSASCVKSGCSASVVVKLKLPRVSSKVCYNMSLGWTDISRSEATATNNGADSGFIHQVMCHSLPDVMFLSPECLIKQSHTFTWDVSANDTNVTVMEVYNRLATLEAAQLKTYLMITTTDSDLCGVAGLLTRAGFSKHPHLPESQMMYTERGPLYLSRVKTKSDGKMHTYLTVYSWDERQLLLLLKAIYNQLPPDSLISLPNKSTSSKDKASTSLAQFVSNPAEGYHISPLQYSIRAMRQEVAKSLSIVEANSKHEQVMDIDTTDDLMGEHFDLDAVRKDFVSRQSRIRDAKCATSGVSATDRREVDDLHTQTDQHVLNMMTVSSDM